MFEYVEDVAVDLACALVNPGAEPYHPFARKVALAVLVSVTLALMVHIYAQDGCIWM